MLKHKQSGMTVVEIAVALAISGLLSGVVLAGQIQLRARARFSDAVETLKNDLAKVQNEAVTTVQEAGTGSNPQYYIFFAKRVMFTNNSNLITVDTLLYDPVSNSIVAGSKDPHNLFLPYNTKYLTAGSTGNEILYVRWPSNGNLYTFTPPTGFSSNDHNFASYDLYNASLRASRTFQFSDSDTPAHTATVTANGATDTITRVYH